MMNKCIVSLLLLLFSTAAMVSAGNLPGAGGGCGGDEGPMDMLASGASGGGGLDDDDDDGFDDDGPRGMGPPGMRRRFLKEIAVPTRKRSLQANGNEPTPDQLESCCTGNGDFEYLMRDLDIDGLAVATEAEGYREIPGDSKWSCRDECRDPAKGYDLESCYEACDCVWNCPTSIDYLTQECKSQCTSQNPLEEEICMENCNDQCGERCKGTFNGYVIPLDIYREGLEILDCVIGDYTGDSQASCNSGQAFWRSVGLTCQVTEGNNFDCECDVAGTCLSVVYSCDYAQDCTTEPVPPPYRPPVPKPPTGKGKGGSGRKKYRKVWDDDY